LNNKNLEIPKCKISIEINNLAGLAFENKFFVEVAKNTFDFGEADYLDGKRVSISVAFVSEDEIRKLNNEYRGKNSATDVLSFSEYANISNLCNNKSKDVFLGEIVICPDYIKKSAEVQKVSFEFELAYIFSHGILHLLGFEHGEKMFSIQEKIARKIVK